MSSSEQQLAEEVGALLTDTDEDVPEWVMSGTDTALAFLNKDGFDTELVDIEITTPPPSPEQIDAMTQDQLALVKKHVLQSPLQMPSDVMEPWLQSSAKDFLILRRMSDADDIRNFPLGLHGISFCLQCNYFIGWQNMYMFCGPRFCLRQGFFYKYKVELPNGKFRYYFPRYIACRRVAFRGAIRLDDNDLPILECAYRLEGGYWKVF